MVWRFRPDLLIAREIARLSALASSSTGAPGPTGAANATPGANGNAGASGPAGASGAVGAVGVPFSLLASATQVFPILIVADKLQPIVSSQAFSLDIVAYKTTITAPNLRVKVGAAAITLGGTMRLTGTSPAITLTGTLLFPSACPGIKVEVTTGGTASTLVFRVSYNSGATWALSGQTPTGGTFALSGAAAGVTLNFAAGTYILADTYEGTAETLRSTEGASYTFTNATAAQQPVFRHASTPGAPEARAGLFFAGAQYLVSSDAAAVALFANDPALTLITRLSYTVLAANGCYFASCASAGTNSKRRFQQLITSPGRNTHVWVNAAAGTGTNTSAAGVLSGAHNVCWFFPGSGGTVNLQVNGGADVQVTAAAAIGTSTPNRLSIGAVADSSADTFYSGYFYDLAAFSSNLNPASRSSWNTELAT